MKCGLIDVGGGLRDIYGAGVLDMCMDSGVRFDYCIGVSAGSANISSFLAGQRRRTFQFYYEYSFRKEYMGLGNFVSKGSYFDLSYVYGTLARSDGEHPIDYDAFCANPAVFEIVATEAETGKAKYFTKSDISLDDYGPLMASSAIPVVCKPYNIDGVDYYDGAISDPVPIQRALDAGCDKTVLILTKPKDVPRSGAKDDALAKVLHHTHPMAAHGLHMRAKRYNEAVERAFELEREGRLLILAPDDITGVDTTKRTREGLLRLYAKGYADGGAIKPFLEK